MLNQSTAGLKMPAGVSLSETGYKGALNVAAYGLFLFVRDVCGGDLVGWIDRRLAGDDHGLGAVGRAAAMRAALLEPLGHINGVGPKLWSLILSDLLLVGDPDRERWVATGASFVAIDRLLHAYLHRTGVLARFGAGHAYGGGACYGPHGCAALIERLAARLDARALNPAFPANFPRFIEMAIWYFCAGWGRDICNGNQVDDRHRCEQVFCPTYRDCDRVALHP